MLLGSLAYVKQITQVMLQLAKLMRRVAQYSPAEHDSAVVLFQVAEVSDRSDVPATNPHATFDLDGDLQARPCKVESPSTFGVETVLAFGRGKTELVRDD